MAEIVLSLTPHDNKSTMHEVNLDAMSNVVPMALGMENESTCFSLWCKVDNGDPRILYHADGAIRVWGNVVCLTRVPVRNHLIVVR